MAGQIMVLGRVINTARTFPSGGDAPSIIGTYGEPGNLELPQIAQDRGSAIGPGHIPQTPFPQPRIPINIPWSPGNGRGIA